MDEMKISSGLMTAVVSKLVNRTIKNKYGECVNVKLNDLHTTVIDGEAHIHIDMDADLKNETLLKLLAKAGL